MYRPSPGVYSVEQSKSTSVEKPPSGEEMTVMPSVFPAASAPRHGSASSSTARQMIALRIETPPSNCYWAARAARSEHSPYVNYKINPGDNQAENARQAADFGVSFGSGGGLEAILGD